MSYHEILTRQSSGSTTTTREKYTPYKSPTSNSPPPKRKEKKSEWSYIHYAVIAVVLFIIVGILAWYFWSSPEKVPNDSEQCDESILDVMKKTTPSSRDCYNERNKKLRRMETECSSTSLNESRNDF